MDQVRIGIVGLGNMGTGHARHLIQNKVSGAVLTAVCDQSPDRLEWARQELGNQLAVFTNVEDMYASGAIDGVIICTPHYAHPSEAIAAFGHGLHVLTEKPAGVYTKQVRDMNQAAKESGKVFGIMYNQRTQPLYRKVKDLIAEGEIGEIRRTNWIITLWYRAQSYYNSGGWRATWAGEGGGVLINQSPHQLDLWQWVVGMMPIRMRAFCSFGKYRTIEVENEVTAYVEYPSGATGVFITSACETPGTNRLEIIGDRGKIVVEDDRLTLYRSRQSETEFNAAFTGMFGQPEYWKIDIPVGEPRGEHYLITQDWINGILQGTPLLSPGEEGIHGLSLSNAMLMSTWTDDWVDFPLDEDRFYELLQEQIRNSKTARTEEPAGTGPM
ncbi:Gfo/Idh/MocA family protein [Paenibacillus lutrae]|uniref:Gfo/Idh/MocA family oxidoreductase n=1 Tax=Paenibacillus lutrae TaxID=2078573 RepID=A0A7X3FKE3_9BACL|nr:Gfo/Idh/MocA family oxidoreductase [Paenibacillus lutrae]MVP01333.1 gfo/Idh/MocA family oxidoreductase [Paenibacillus lutrae]